MQAGPWGSDRKETDKNALSNALDMKLKGYFGVYIYPLHDLAKFDVCRVFRQNFPDVV
jgi:predicted RNA methylase